MSDNAETSAPKKRVFPSWDPITPEGVASFARAGTSRLMATQLVSAFIMATLVFWFLETRWFPVVGEAIHNLPAASAFSNGRLNWTGESTSQSLAQNPFLGFSVDLYHSGKIGREAQLQIEFGQDDLRLYSVLGYEIYEYPAMPAEKSYAFNQPELDPWWGAWRPMFLAGAFLFTVASLMISWFLLAWLYCPLTWLLSFFLNRNLNWTESWRLSGACLIPGAIFIIVGFFAYAMGWIGLLNLAAIYGLHLIVGWIYLVMTPFFLKKSPRAAKESVNPFSIAPEPVALEAKKAKKQKNPFQ